jgi:hypothetical protein
MRSTGSYLAPNCLKCNTTWALGQSEPGSAEKLHLFQSLAMSCIGLINDLAAFHFSDEIGRGVQASTSSEMLGVADHADKGFGGSNWPR